MLPTKIKRVEAVTIAVDGSKTFNDFSHDEDFSISTSL